jgi:hypothetical protein
MRHLKVDVKRGPISRRPPLPAFPAACFSSHTAPNRPRLWRYARTAGRSELPVADGKREACYIRPGMLKTLLYVVLTTLAAVLLLAFGLGLDAGPFQIERSKEIAAPAAAVFANLDDLHRWNTWFPWLKVDEHISKHVHSGAPKGVGAIYEWESDAKPGHSRIAIVESQPPRASSRAISSSRAEPANFA